MVARVFRIQMDATPRCVDPHIPSLDFEAFQQAFSPPEPPAPSPRSAGPPPACGATGERGGAGYVALPLGQVDRPSGVLRVWFLLLEGVGCTASACTKNHQPQILQSLFEMLRATATVPGQSTTLPPPC